MANDTANPMLGGVKVKEYKDQAADLSNESLEVRRWREYIAAAERILAINERMEAAAEGDEYLNGTKVARNGRAIYFRYLVPILEDLFRRTIPRVPSPRIEARTEAAESFVDTARELVRRFFDSGETRIEHIAEQLQWDDARMGIGIAKTVYERSAEAASPSYTADPEQIIAEQDKAGRENDQPILANIAENDVHFVHAYEHGNAMATMDAMSPEYTALWKHWSDHMTALTVVKTEWMSLRRVPPHNFVYDTNVPWYDRGWEAEKRSVKVQELIELGYRNINPSNLPPEVPLGYEAMKMPYEDMTVQVWDIHDRNKNKYYIVSATGPTDGRFIHVGDWEYKKIDIYYPLVFRPWEPHDAHGLSTIQMCMPVLDKLASVDFYINRHVENHCNSKGLYPSGSLSGEAKSGLANPDQRFVGLPPEALMGFKEYVPPAIPDTLLEYREILLSELRRIVGADAQDTGAEYQRRITATESSHRGAARAERKYDRQERMGDFLAWAAKNFMAIYKKFGVLDRNIRVIGANGPEYRAVSPADIPDDLDVYLDVKAETSEAKLEDRQIAAEVMQILQATPQYSTDWTEAVEWTLRRLGVMRPEQFRSDMPQMPVGAGGQIQTPNAGQPQMQMPQGGMQMQTQQTASQPRDFTR